MTTEQIQKEIKRHENAIRTLELIDLEQTIRQNHQDTYDKCKSHGMNSLLDHQSHKLEICDMVIERLTQRYESICLTKKK